MPAYYPHVVTPPNYLVNDAYQVPIPHYNTYAAPFPYAPAHGAIYQQPQYYMPEVDYGTTYYGKPRSVSSSSARGVGSYSSNGTTFFMPNIPVDHGGFISKQHQQHQQQQHHYPQQQQPQSENVTGGVSATLDYDIEEMAEFVSNMALGIMRPNSTSMKSDRPSQNFLEAFRKFTCQVLTATRMPKATVILALVYLSKRWALGNIPSTTSNVHSSYKMLVVALLLANKFHDDNTFTNNSWHEATGVPVRDLSLIECDWLKAIQWSLHLNQTERKGWEKWNDCWEYWVNTRKPASRYPSVSQTRYPLSPAGSDTAVVSTEKVCQLLSSPAPSYTVPKWFVNSHTDPLRASRSSSLDSLHSVQAPINTSDQFVSYFQQSFAGNRPYDDERAYPHHSSSFYVPSFGTAACNCNYCSFDAVPTMSKWYNGTATVC